MVLNDRLVFFCFLLMLFIVVRRCHCQCVCVLEFGYKIEKLGMKGGSHERSTDEESKIREVYGDKSCMIIIRRNPPIYAIFSVECFVQKDSFLLLNKFH